MSENAQENKSELRRPSSRKPASQEEPGLLETVGSFPVWLLKIIDFFTPESLTSKSPPAKKKIRY
jgi:hypothetical protein